MPIIHKDPSYIKIIEGIRALAITVVVIYHAHNILFGAEILPGGFVGVDIFFVISGFLITKKIKRELELNKFSFSLFYEKRCRRILPLLFFVLLASLVLGEFFLLPKEFVEFSKSLLSSLLFSSNIYFEKSNQAYNSGLLNFKPLLHTWSLSVEEQFYLLFPIFIYILYVSKKDMFKSLLLIFFFSLILCCWGIDNKPYQAFYSLFFRVWEFLAGALLNYINKPRKHILKGYNFETDLGFVFIIFSIFVFNDRMPLPSLYSLIPIVGTLLLISHSNSKSLVFVFLSSRPVVFIGSISYSIYLWHVPMFAYLMHIEIIHSNWSYRIIVIPALLLLSIATYFFIERPFRNFNKISTKQFVFFVVIFWVILFIFGSTVIINNGFVSRVSPIFQREYNNDWSRLAVANNQCFNRTKDFCVFNPAGHKTVYLVGDSILASISEDLVTKLSKLDFKVVLMTMDSCFFAPNVNKINSLTRRPNKDETCLASYQNLRLKTILNDKNSIVMIGGRLPLILTSQMFDNKEGGIEGRDWGFNFISNDLTISLEEEIKNGLFNLLENRHQIILIYPIPEVGWNVPKKIFNAMPKSVVYNSRYLQDKPLTSSYRVFQERTADSYNLLDSIKGKGIFRVYPESFLCNNQIKMRCVTHDLEDLYYSDSSHPSKRGAEIINNLIINEIYKIN